MKTPMMIRPILVLSGLTATVFGFAVLAVPHALHASMGITLGDDVNLLNEVRSSGGMLLACGLFALYGAVRTRMALPALVVSAAVYLTYGLSRVTSVIIDGVPNNAMFQSMGVELALGLVCLIALRSLRRSDLAAVW